MDPPVHQFLIHRINPADAGDCSLAGAEEGTHNVLPVLVPHRLRSERTQMKQQIHSCSCDLEETFQPEG